MGDYRKLRVWQQARALTNRSYRVTASFPRQEQFGLTAQIRRAAVSVMANIAEGCGRNRDGELLRFLTIARGSVTELDCHLIIAQDQGYLEEKIMPGLQLQVERIQRMLTLLIRRLGNK
jgi:four helix bundle protein